MDGILFSKILQMSLIGCYCIMIVLVARCFLRRIGRKYSYYLWLIVFINLCIPFSIFSSFSLIPRNIASVTFEDTELSKAQLKENEPDDSNGAPNIVVFDQNGLMSYEKNKTEVLSDKEAGIQTTGTSNTGFGLLKEISYFALWEKALPWLEIIWILGVCFFVFYSIQKTVRLEAWIRKVKGKDSSSKEGIVEVEGLESAFLWGGLHPTIYLPKGMEPEEQVYILAHEQCHRRRKDHLVKIFIYGVTVLHWFNPLIWVAYSLCCKDIEISCDESVLEHSDKNIRRAYAESLLKYAAKQNHYVMNPLTFGEPSVKSRISNVLEYRKKSVVVSVVALVLTGVVAAGLLMRPKPERTVPEMPEGFRVHEEETAGEQTSVINNGGEIIRAGNDIFYMDGKKLFFNGEKLYATQTGDDGVDYIYEYKPDGSAMRRMREGTLLGCDDSYIYSYLKDEEGLHLKRSKLHEMDTEEPVLELPGDMDGIYCFSAGDTLVFSMGHYEGSAGYFYGEFYSYDLNTKELKQAHLTDDDEFLVLDGFVYYQKYEHEGNRGSELYRAGLDFSEEERVFTEAVELLQADKETGTLLVSMDGKLLRMSPDGAEEACLFDLADAGWIWQEYDKLLFREVNVIENEIYVRAQHWGYTEENGWRDSLIGEQYFCIQADGSGFQAWNPDALLAEDEEEFRFLSDPIPGQPCENPAEAGWNLENAIDMREKFEELLYTPEDDTKVYLLENTEHYTLYGKGDYLSMLLACGGSYAEITYPYTSNYMIKPQLLEGNFDGDNRQELAIKYNLQHGTGLSIDTFFMADFHSDGKLYVHQFLDEDYNARLMEHLSYEKTEDGIQALVDGKPAGRFMENDPEMAPWGTADVGAQIHFYYVEDEIQISADIQFWVEDENAMIYWTNSNDVTATVSWKDTGEFVLTDFRSRNRDLDEEIVRALYSEYGTEDISVTNIRYDSSKMNEESLNVTATILPKGGDSYDYAELIMKWSEENALYSGNWEVEEILLEK